MEFVWEERQWPFDATRLEIIASRAGLHEDDLREYLRGEIAERRGEPSVVTDSRFTEVDPVEEIDWGQVLDNHGPEGVAALMELLGVERRAPFMPQTSRDGPNRAPHEH